jgi:toxin ParE1/3/4
MLPLVWTQDAREQLAGIVEYIAVRAGNPPAARRIKERIEDAVERLPGHPFLYRKGRVPGTREAVVHPNYIVVYRVGATAIEIVGVLHSRQQYP